MRAGLVSLLVAVAAPAWFTQQHNSTSAQNSRGLTSTLEAPQVGLDRPGFIFSHLLTTRVGPPYRW